jgi:3-oxoacyl-[acyl-carrier protein] reductase
MPGVATLVRAPAWVAMRIAAHTGRERSSHYSAAKGAVLSFTKSLATELGPEIRVNAVSPGFIETQLSKATVADQGEGLLSRIPLGRLGTPSEVAHAIAYLCSDSASYITGQTLHVNGGLYISG